jgi:hypothetical protein
MKAIFTAIWLSIGALLSGMLLAETPEHASQIQHDPFQKPARLQPKIFQPATETTAKPQVAEFNLAGLALTAILQAGQNSMVILAGKTLKLGDVFEGYRLVEIQERAAVFSKDQKNLVLKIDKSDVDN